MLHCILISSVHLSSHYCQNVYGSSALPQQKAVIQCQGRRFQLGGTAKLKAVSLGQHGTAGSRLCLDRARCFCLKLISSCLPARHQACAQGCLQPCRALPECCIPTVTPQGQSRGTEKSAHSPVKSQSHKLFNARLSKQLPRHIAACAV